MGDIINLFGGEDNNEVIEPDGFTVVYKLPEITFNGKTVVTTVETRYDLYEVLETILDLGVIQVQILPGQYEKVKS